MNIFEKIDEFKDFKNNLLKETKIKLNSLIKNLK